jgi:hypothetical protein
MEDQRKSGEHWHLDKRINVGHFLTTITIAGAMIVWAMSIDARVSEQDVMIKNNSEAIAASEARSFRSLDEIRSTMNRINDKLDRLIERK